MTFAVGFDLDLTLIDSRPGIAATYHALVAATGVPVDVALATSRLGPPLQDELANWFPADQVPAAVAQYRALYPDHAIVPSPPLPGAVAAIDAVHAAGGKVVVITAKHDRLARIHLDYLGLPVDQLIGLVWADGKARALVEVAAIGYVGDHVADMRAARTAGIPGLGVRTGPCSAAELTEAGAHTVLPDLTGFPEWLAEIGVGQTVPGS